MPASSALVTATIIARNEAHHLAPCLASLAGLVDDIVVVDTGSADATRDIARQHGVRLFEFAWCDDFSAARNFAIDQAGGDWLLYIDADERARGCTAAELRADLSDPHMAAATVRFTPRTGFTAYREPRLIRRDPRIRFHGAMHETYMGDVDRLVATGAGHIGATRLALDHVGYDGSQSHKLDRNLRLLHKQIAADPSRPYLHWHLGAVYRDLGRQDDAEASWLHGMQLGRAAATPQIGQVLCALEIAKLRVARGEPAEDVFALCAACDPENWLLHWLRGKQLLAANELDAAQPIFESLGAVDADSVVHITSYDRRIFGAWALAELAEAAFRLRRFADSAAWFARAARLAPAEMSFRIKQRLAQTRA